jgi:hypothetical protein
MSADDLCPYRHLLAREYVATTLPISRPLFDLRETTPALAAASAWRGPEGYESSGGAYEQLIRELHRYSYPVKHTPPDNQATNSSRTRSAPATRPLPRSKFQQLEKAVASVADRSRPEQQQFVRSLPEFEDYHITDRLFRNVFKQVLVRRGRRPKK